MRLVSFILQTNEINVKVMDVNAEDDKKNHYIERVTKKYFYLECMYRRFFMQIYWKSFTVVPTCCGLLVGVTTTSRYMAPGADSMSTNSRINYYLTFGMSVSDAGFVTYTS